MQGSSLCSKSYSLTDKQISTKDKILARFQKAIEVNGIEKVIDFIGDNTIQIGQWFKDSTTGQRGQYLGLTKAGVVVMSWRCSFKRHNQQTKLLRKFALANS